MSSEVNMAGWANLDGPWKSVAEREAAIEAEKKKQEEQDKKDKKK